MRLIIIGVSSFIGQEVYRVAKNKGIETIGTYFQHKVSGCISFDLRTESLDQLKEHIGELTINDRVLFCSAEASIDNCFSDPIGSRQLNVDGTKRLMDSLAKREIPFIFLSSEAVFDGSSGYYREADKVNPITEYGRQKAEIEQYIMCSYPENLIIRISRALGDTYEKGHLFYEFYHKAQNGLPIICLKDQSFTPTYIHDIAEMLLGLSRIKAHGIYHISNNQLYTRKSLAEEFCMRLGLTPHIEELVYEEMNFLDNRHILGGLNGEKCQALLEGTYTPVEEVICRFRQNIKNAYKGV